jgi:hypothetical protein
MHPNFLDIRLSVGVEIVLGLIDLKPVLLELLLLQVGVVSHIAESYRVELLGFVWVFDHGTQNVLLHVCIDASEEFGRYVEFVN